MSHWIEAFALLESSSGAVVFEPSDSNWSLDSAVWLNDSTVLLRLRRYPGDHTPPVFEVKVDCQACTAEVAGQTSIPLQAIDSVLDGLYRKSTNA